MTDSNSNGTLYNRILTQEGIKGLLLFMFATFIMAVIYQGQQKAQTTLEQIQAASTLDALEEAKQTEILEDIRYALREREGLTFRNSFQSIE